MTPLLTAVSLVLDLTQAAARLTQQAAGISALIAKAQTEGREFTAEEWAQIVAADDKAKADLDAAIRSKSGS